MLTNQNIAPESKKFNVLYVDDEETNLRIFQVSFRKDYNVFTACNGEQAINVMDNHEIDLIITDQQMPQMTGVDLLRKVVPSNPGVLRMIMTGFADTNALIEAVNEIGINKYIKKPWSRDILKETLDHELDQYLKEKGISNASESNEVGVNEVIEFVQKTLLKSEEEIKNTFNLSFYLHPKSRKTGEAFWVGNLNGAKVFCKVGVRKLNSSTEILLNGLYATMCNGIYSLNTGSVDASSLFEQIERELIAKEYLSFAEKCAADGIDILCVVQSEETISIKSNSAYGMIQYEDQREEWIEGMINLQVPNVRKVILGSAQFERLINNKQQSFRILVEDSFSLTLEQQRKYLSEELINMVEKQSNTEDFGLFGFEF